MLAILIAELVDSIPVIIVGAVALSLAIRLGAAGIEVEVLKKRVKELGG